MSSCPPKARFYRELQGFNFGQGFCQDVGSKVQFGRTLRNQFQTFLNEIQRPADGVLLHIIKILHFCQPQDAQNFKKRNVNDSRLLELPLEEAIHSMYLRRVIKLMFVPVNPPPPSATTLADSRLKFSLKRQTIPKHRFTCTIRVRFLRISGC